MKVLSNVTQAGLDSHRKFGNLTARDAQKNVVSRMKLDYTNPQAVARQLSQLPPGTPVIVESSFGWGWICDELAARGLSPRLASAAKVSAFRKLKSKAKTNKIDSNALSELPLDEDWWRVWLAPQEVRDQRELLRYRMGLVQCQTQTKLRIHALLHRHGIIQPHSDLFGVGGRKFLKLLAGLGLIAFREALVSCMTAVAKLTGYGDAKTISGLLSKYKLLPDDFLRAYTVAPKAG